MALFGTCWTILLPSALLLLQSWALGEEAAARVASEVSTESTLSVLRCCRANEDLDKPGPDGQVRCTASSSRFHLEIYSPEEMHYLENIPSWWKIHEGLVPTCSDNQVLQYVQRSKSNPYFIFDNGLVITELGPHGIHLSTNDYCLSSNALMACLPRTEGHPAAATMKPRLRKCCGEYAAYEK